MCVTIGTGTAYPSRAPEFIPVFNGVRVLRSLVFCIVLFRSLFVLFLYLLVTVLSVLRFMDSDYPFGIYFTYFVPVFKYCYSDSRNL
jgi:hypothetical protein